MSVEMEYLNIGGTDYEVVDREARDTKADQDGDYDQMTVGNAEQLVSSTYVEEQTPYGFRTAGGSADIGNRMYDTIVGGTVAWNQLVQNGDFSNGTTGFGANNASLSVVRNVLTFTPSSGTKAANFGVLASASFQKIIGHKYLYSFYATVSEVISTFAYNVLGESIKYRTISANTELHFVGVIATTSAGTVRPFFYPFGATSQTFDGSQTAEFRNVMIVDLTQMFGSAIADYIYSLETATAGAGVAWFKKLFPKDYYEYNAGELMSVNVSEHNTVGFNAYNPSTGTAKLVGGNEYQITGTYTSVTYTDINGDTETLSIDSDGYFTPTNNGTLTVTGGNSTDTCVHLVWSGYRDDEYEEYEAHSYELDSSLTLRGIPKLDASNVLYYDGDTYESDGTVTRKYGIVDLGTFDWVATNSETGAFRVSTPVSYIKYLGNLITAIGLNNPKNASIDNWADKSIGATNSQVYVLLRVKDSSYAGFTATDFKTAMSGVYLVYELATPTTETADSFASPQIVDDFGTEEYIDYAESQGTRDVAIPVGHDSKYLTNLRDKLQRLPAMPDADGTYLVTYANRKCTFSAYVAPTGLPAAPSTDGTYTLNCTVADGTATYSWS